jgi:hypothetical protein
MGRSPLGTGRVPVFMNQVAEHDVSPDRGEPASQGAGE